MKRFARIDNVIVVINANNTMELGWIDNYEQIKSVILAPGAGETGFTALGEILNGTVNPSGKTADTYVKNLLSTHYINNIGNFPYTNVDDLKAQALAADSSYKEMFLCKLCRGIYVGYKFYETAAEEGLIDYESSVRYPFDTI
ncbi:MAG: glycoside hydrolase family 3 C-terminal domain-containing protein [Blautia faecis]